MNRTDRTAYILKTAIMICTAIMIIPGADSLFAAEDTAALAASAGIGEGGRGLAYAAMGAVGISCMASAYALSKIGSAAMGAMSEKPEIGGRALIFLGMAEGIAIYGLIIAIMLINKI